MIISIHALREEGDMAADIRVDGMSAFLSTPSARRATLWSRAFSITPAISIHALREEGDNGFEYNMVQYDKFLSTPSARRATPNVAVDGHKPVYFYPRPPRGGRPTIWPLMVLWENFYPRPPRGGRHHCWIIYNLTDKFLSTPSARRATKGTCDLFSRVCISIHALREEGDRKGV